MANQVQRSVKTVEQRTLSRDYDSQRARKRDRESRSEREQQSPHRSSSPPDLRRSKIDNSNSKTVTNSCLGSRGAAKKRRDLLLLTNVSFIKIKILLQNIHKYLFYKSGGA
jgi:hypothetical protein